MRPTRHKLCLVLCSWSDSRMPCLQAFIPAPHAVSLFCRLLAPPCCNAPQAPGCVLPAHHTYHVHPALHIVATHPILHTMHTMSCFCLPCRLAWAYASVRRKEGRLLHSIAAAAESIQAQAAAPWGHHTAAKGGGISACAAANLAWAYATLGQYEPGLMEALAQVRGVLSDWLYCTAVCTVVQRV